MDSQGFCYWGEVAKWSGGHYGRWAFLPIGGYIRIARRAIHNPQRPKAAVNPKNLSFTTLSFTTLSFTTLLHNLRQSRPFYLSIHFLQSSSIGSRNSLLLMKDSLQA